MTTPIWKLMPRSNMRDVDVVWRRWDDGKEESCLVTAPEYLAEMSEGASLKDAEGNDMTAEQITAFLETLT